MARGWPVGYSYSQIVGDLKSGQSTTNRASAKDGDLNPRPSNYQSSSLTTRPRLLYLSLFLDASHFNKLIRYVFGAC